MTTFNKISLLVILLMGMMLWAQSGTTTGLTSAATGAACTVATGATGTLCTAGDGLWYAVGTGAFQKVFLGTPSSGVTSFNGRTGAVMPVVGDYPQGVISFNGRAGVVVPVAGDYPQGVTSFNGQAGSVTSAAAGIAYSDLQGTPIQKPSIACSTSSVGNSGLTASGCN